MKTTTPFSIGSERTVRLCNALAVAVLAVGVLCTGTAIAAEPASTRPEVILWDDFDDGDMAGWDQAWGNLVAGTSGELLARASADREEVLVVPVELKQVDSTRTQWPFLRDRRTDAYGGLTQRLID